MLGLSPLIARLLGSFLIVGAFVGMYLLWQRDAARLETAQSELSTAQDELTITKRRNAVLEQASIERAQDSADVAQTAKELNDAIKDVPAGTAPSPAALALGCERLRRAGATTSDAFRNICGGRAGAH